MRFEQQGAFIEAKPLQKLLGAHPLVGHQIMTAVAKAYFDRYHAMMARIQKVLADRA